MEVDDWRREIVCRRGREALGSNSGFRTERMEEESAADLREVKDPGRIDDREALRLWLRLDLTDDREVFRMFPLEKGYSDVATLSRESVLPFSTMV